jgi:hypothetical protein
VGKNSDFVQRIQPGSTTLDWLARRLKESTAYKLAVAAEKTWLSFQLKVLHIAGPLVYLHQLAKKVRLMDMEEVSENVKVASELTATVSYNISRRRRQNILNHTDPRYDYLLKDPKSFTSKQTGSSILSASSKPC